jgi:hypothetical protein
MMALLVIVTLFMAIYDVTCRCVEKRAMRRMRATEREAAFIDARNFYGRVWRA